MGHVRTYSLVCLLLIVGMVALDIALKMFTIPSLPLWQACRESIEQTEEGEDENPQDDTPEPFVVDEADLEKMGKAWQLTGRCLWPGLNRRLFIREHSHVVMTLHPSSNLAYAAIFTARWKVHIYCFFVVFFPVSPPPLRVRFC